MIKFFRKIRQRLVTENKFSKPASPAGRYLLCAIGEIILVVIGILINLKFTNKNVFLPSWERTKGWVLR